MTQPATTTSIPRGVPAEQPVELVAVTSRLGRWSVGLLAVIALELGFLCWCAWRTSEDCRRTVEVLALKLR